MQDFQIAFGKEMSKCGKKREKKSNRRCSQSQEQQQKHANSAICCSPDLVDKWGIWVDSHWHVFVSVHTWTMNTAEDSTEHDLSQNNLCHRDGQQHLQPCVFYCPETALPVLSPGQSISAEFGTSSRGGKRARRISPTRQKTREGILEWKEEKTKELQ